MTPVAAPIVVPQPPVQTPPPPPPPQIVDPQSKVGYSHDTDPNKGNSYDAADPKTDPKENIQNLDARAATERKYLLDKFSKTYDDNKAIRASVEGDKVVLVNPAAADAAAGRGEFPMKGGAGEMRKWLDAQGFKGTPVDYRVEHVEAGQVDGLLDSLAGARNVNIVHVENKGDFDVTQARFADVRDEGGEGKAVLQRRGSTVVAGLGAEQKAVNLTGTSGNDSLNVNWTGAKSTTIEGGAGSDALSSVGNGGSVFIKDTIGSARDRNWIALQGGQNARVQTLGSVIDKDGKVKDTSGTAAQSHIEVDGGSATIESGGIDDIVVGRGEHKLEIGGTAKVVQSAYADHELTNDNIKGKSGSNFSLARYGFETDPNSGKARVVALEDKGGKSTRYYQHSDGFLGIGSSNDEVNHMALSPNVLPQAQGDSNAGSISPMTFALVLALVGAGVGGLAYALNNSGSSRRHYGYGYDD